MSRETNQFIGFALVFLVLYVASEMLKEVKDLSGWILFLGVLYLGFKMSQK